MILLNLPLKDLLLVQAVSRQWRAIWRECSRIQQALFLKPFRPKTIDFVTSGEEEAWRIWTTPHGVQLYDDPFIDPFINRFIRDDDNYSFVMTEDGYEHYPHDILHQGFIDVFCHETLQDATGWYSAFHRTEASWRSMLFIQPAASRLRFWCSQEMELRKIHNETGVTLDEIQISLYAHLRTCIRCPRSWSREDKWSWSARMATNLPSVEMTGYDVLAELEVCFNTQPFYMYNCYRARGIHLQSSQNHEGKRQRERWRVISRGDTLQSWAPQ